MLYRTILKKIRKENLCPFCKIGKDLIIKENRFAYLTPAMAAYRKDHLLVIPKKHKLKLEDLTKKEKIAILDLLVFGNSLLEKKYPAVELIYKEGDLTSARKTIPHMHFHLVPRNKARKEQKDKRKFLKKSEAIKIVTSLKEK